MQSLQIAATSDLCVDTAQKSHAASPFLVSAIGSCRIAGPLRHAASYGKFEVNQSGILGYSHSSAEAVQILCHLQDGTSSPPELLPLVAPRMAGSEVPLAAHHPSDMYFFELSSAKVLSVDGYAVQLNYVNRHFAHFFEDIATKRRYWALAQSGTSKEMTGFLESVRAYCALPPDDRAILRNIRLSLATPETLRRDITELHMRAPAALFVTHFDAYDANQELLRGRATYLKELRQALRECNVRWFDPSDYVAAFGQDAALDIQKNSLTHYSAEFEALLANNWSNRYIEPFRQLKLTDQKLRQRIQANARAAECPQSAPRPTA